MTEHRWSKFWWTDYEGDDALKLCSLAAQGLWMRMLCAMHRGTPHGHLAVNGVAPSGRQLAIMLSATEREIAKLIPELEAARVFDRNADGLIFNRRLVRDRGVSEWASENGKNGGNPNILRGTVPKEQRVRPFKRSDAPEKTARILARTNGRCHWCDVQLQCVEAGPDFFHVDHVIAVRDGGTNDESNLVASCAACNHKRARVQSDHNPRHQRDLVSALKPEADTEADTEAERPSLRSGRAREANGSRLPDDWQPAEPGYDGATPVTLAKFRDYWRAQPGAKGRKADWDATWRNWCRRDAEQPKPKLHTLPPGEQDRRILAAVGLNFTDPPPPARVPILPLRAVK